MLVANIDADYGGKKKKTARSGASGGTAQSATAQTQSAGSTTRSRLDALAQGYQPSDAVRAAAGQVEAARSNEPSAYQSRFSDRLAALYDAMENRAPFSYDLGGDALYRQYREQYTNLGKLAMNDTLAQTASLTGGYGSSYAQNAGQQAYNAYLQQLGEVVPELYEQAYARYTDEGDALYRQYAMLADAEDADYARWQDSYARYRDALSDARADYADARDLDYDTWKNLMAYYQNEADREQAQANHDEEMALSRAKLASGGEKVSDEILKMVWALYGDDEELRRYLNARVIGGWLTSEQAAALYENYS